MDSSQGEWNEASFIHRMNVTPEEICTNIRANAGKLIPEVSFKSICICASGPSLADHIEDIRLRQKAGWSVASMNGSHNFLINHGIIPDYYFQIDARKGNLSFLEKANDHTTYVIGSQCDPEIFEALEGRKIKLWQVHNYEGAFEAIKENAPNATVFYGSYNVGQSCLNPILAMGYRIWHLFGFDGSIRDGEKHAFAQPQNVGEEVHTFQFEGKTYFATATMAHHASSFYERYQLFTGLGIRIELFGDGLLQAMVRSEIERRKLFSNIQPAPPPKPRVKRADDRLRVVFWKWHGHIPYTPEHVNHLAEKVSENLRMPHEIVCITDDPAGIDGGIRAIPLWRDEFEHGRDWHRVKIFAPEMADIIGPRLVSLDLDTVVCGELDSLFDHAQPFKAWRDPNRPHQYCTSVFQMDAGAFPHVWERFDAKQALELRLSGQYGGYDQAWISHVLPGQPMWTQADGVLSFKVDILGRKELEEAEVKPLPANARIINFHGQYDPSQERVRERFPWAGKYWNE